MTLTFKVATQMLRATRRFNKVIISLKYFKIQLQLTKLCTGLGFAAKSCCDLDPQGINPNVARDKSFQYGYYFNERVLKSDFK